MPSRLWLGFKIRLRRGVGNRRSSWLRWCCGRQRRFPTQRFLCRSACFGKCCGARTFAAATTTRSC